MNIPDEVLEQADAARYVNASAHAAYSVIAEWARKEALREAAVAVEWRFNISQAAVGRAIHDHAEGVSDGQQ